MEKVKMILTSSTAKRFYWNTLNGAIGVLIVELSNISWVYAPLVIAVLNGITKEINNRRIK